MYYYGARYYEPRISLWMSTDMKEEKYPNFSSYCYTANNPIKFIDPTGNEWNYFIDSKGYITINLTLNFSISGDLTPEQITAYKNAIATQFNKTLSSASGGKTSGVITFCEENPKITQRLNLGKMDKAIGGQTFMFQSSVNLYDKNDKLRTPTEVASDAIHELFHTVRLDHPFELTQTEDTKLLRVGINSYVSTSTTDADIVNNVMSYPMIMINNQKSSNQNSLTKGQLKFILKEIDLQNRGYGFLPIYDNNLTNEENAKIANQYYHDYWNNIPGTPVGDK